MKNIEESKKHKKLNKIVGDLLEIFTKMAPAAGSVVASAFGVDPTAAASISATQPLADYFGGRLKEVVMESLAETLTWDDKEAACREALFLALILAFREKCGELEIDLALKEEERVLGNMI